MSKLTNKQCEASFKSLCAEINYELGLDPIMDREFYNDYTDSLCKDGMITEKQYETMPNPF